MSLLWSEGNGYFCEDLQSDASKWCNRAIIDAAGEAVVVVW